MCQIGIPSENVNAGIQGNAAALMKGIPIEHFGLRLRSSKYGHQLSKDNFAVFDNHNTPGKIRRNPEYFKDPSMDEYTDQWCKDIIK